MSKFSTTDHGVDDRAVSRRYWPRNIVIVVLLLIPSLVAASMNGAATARTVNRASAAPIVVRSSAAQPDGVGDSSGCTVDGVRVAEPDDPSHCDVIVLHSDAGYDISNPAGQYFGDLYVEQDNGDGTYSDLSSEQLYVFNDGGTLEIGALPNSGAASNATSSTHAGKVNVSGDARPAGDTGAACLLLAISAVVLGIVTLGFFAAGTYAAFVGGLNVLGHVFTLAELNQMATVAGTGAGLFGYVRSLIGC